MNTTGLEERPLEEINRRQERYSTDDAIRVLLITLAIALQVAVLSTDTFLIYVLSKHRRLRTRINIYILNCAVINMLLSIVEPLLEAIAGVSLSVSTDYTTDSLLKIYELFTSVLSTLRILYAIFAFGLALDWFVSLWRPNIIRKYDKYYKYVFFGVYLVCILEGLISSSYHHGYGQYNRYDVLVPLYIIMLTTVVLMHVFGRRMQLNEYSTETAYPLTTSYIILLSFLPLPLIFGIYKIYDYVYDYYNILLRIGMIFTYIFRCHPILVVYMLGRQNKYFKVAYRQCFKCCCNRCRGGNLEEAVDDESSNRLEDVEVNRVNGDVQIPTRDHVTNTLIGGI